MPTSGLPDFGKYDAALAIDSWPSNDAATTGWRAPAALLQARFDGPQPSERPLSTRNPRTLVFGTAGADGLKSRPCGVTSTFASG